MRFDQIQIPAFGPFTDFSLGFPSSENDLHLIYGLNERGKSSLLRSIDHLLFGIPARTDDNFIHANPKLRIGASIEAANQAPLSFQRKKGNANTLLDADGNTLPETEIKAFLGPVDRSFFSSMFGLNTESLRDGAYALIAGEGELGAALFSASLGNNDIDAAIDKLKTEANSLFKGRARVKIPTAINAFKDCEKGIREATIKVTAWKSHQKDLLAAQDDFDHADQLQKASDQRRLTLQRFLNAQPLTSQLAQAESRLAELAHIPELPTDFAKRVRVAQERTHELRQTLTERKNQLESFEKQLTDLQTAPSILARAADIEQLHQSISSHSSRSGELPNLIADAEATAKQLTQVVDQLSIDSNGLSALPPITNLLVDDVRTLTEAIREQTRIEANAQTSLKRLEKERKTLTEELTNAPAPDTSASLKALKEKARSALTASEQKDQLVAELEKLTRSSQAHSAQLGLAQAEGILHLSPPSIDVIHEEKTTCETLTNRIVQQRDELSDMDTRLADESTHLEALRNKGALYNQDDLIKKRQERDQQLSTVLDAWNEGSAGIPALGQELSANVQSADAIADSLHQHAEQIALAEKHTHTISTIERKREVLQAALEASQADLDRWQIAWEIRCQSIPTSFRKPNDALDWVKTLEQLRADLMASQDLLDRISKITVDIEKTQQTLVTALDKPDADLATLAVILEGRLEAISEASGTRKALVKQQGELKEKISNATEELEAAQAARTSDEVRLKPLQAPFPCAIDVLQKAQALQTKHAEQKRRIAAEETAIAEMNQRIAALAQDVIPDVDASDVEVLVHRLWKRLTSAKEADSQSQVLLKGIADSQTQLASTQAALDAEISKLEELQTLCKATDAASLEATLSDLEKRREFTGSIADAHNHLAAMSAGQALAEFIKEATEQAEDELRREMADLETILPEHQAARDTARERLNALKAEDQRLQQASDLAATHQQQGQLHLSEIVTDSRRFIELQHAIQFLRQQIELYREKTQAPMIQSTSAYFAALTNGAFDRVSAQLNEKGVPQLVGVREDGSFLPTAAMSEGTADQLYLALRFAAIDLHLAAHPPMPLILDDLLITFDDERTSALLPILANLSQKTQILVFTHHQHLLDIFGKILPGKHMAQRI